MVAISDFDDEDERLQRVEYTYDAFDNRVGRKVFEGTSSTPSESGHFIYDGQQIVLVLDDSGDVENRYLWGPGVDQLLAQEDGGGDVLWALGDHQNTVRDWAEYDTGTTTVVDHAEYDAFGNRLNAAAVAAAFGWTGRYRDQATGLQYNWHRWYDPGAGRWLSEDWIWDGPNKYAYVGNSPTNAIDPWGLAGWNDPPDEWIIPPGTDPNFPGGLPGFDTPTFPPGIIWPAPPDPNEIKPIDLDYCPGGIECFTYLPPPFGPIACWADRIKDELGVGHRKKRPSTEEKHEKGEERRKRDKRGGEKGDKRRPYKRAGIINSFHNPETAWSYSG